MQSTILVGDIGSTKSTWWYRTTDDHEIHLQGYNPTAHSKLNGQELFSSLREQTKSISVSAIWYYGTGVISEKIELEISRELSKVFPDSQLHIHSDLIGAAIAANGRSAGTIAILGTGSHAAVWDGSKITRQATSLGYILGDEGSGCDIGKSIIQAYFYNELPEPIRIEMNNRLPEGRVGFFEHLNSAGSPNQYLASFASIAGRFKEDPWIKGLISNRFKLFVKRHLLSLNPEGAVHVIGTIGFIFEDLLTEELKQTGLTAGTFIQNPSRQLFESHISNG